MSLKKELHQMLRKLKKLGYNIIRSGGNHYKISKENENKKVFLSSTPSDHRSIYNMQNQLKKQFSITI